MKNNHQNHIGMFLYLIQGGSFHYGFSYFLLSVSSSWLATPFEIALAMHGSYGHHH